VIEITKQYFNIEYEQWFRTVVEPDHFTLSSASYDRLEEISN
jgi:hypothetical protein